MSVKRARQSIRAVKQAGRGLDGDMIVALQKDGWYEVATKGSHVQFRHPGKPGRVTVPHPKRDIPIGTLKADLS